ncbi:hypothetical protein [Burkholderia sp. BCC0405]|uniref:hypothetical protein n=1 Tax=Burkholderia sp. BCC0405 TaxID=2676298 RepID=UPI00158A1AFD|nr:hypothetical protein [Burkholderia sp. BCC0405]
MADIDHERPAENIADEIEKSLRPNMKAIDAILNQLNEKDKRKEQRTRNLFSSAFAVSFLAITGLILTIGDATLTKYFRLILSSPLLSGFLLATATLGIGVGMLAYLRDSGPISNKANDKLIQRLNQLQAQMVQQAATHNKEIGSLVLTDQTREQILSSIKTEIDKYAADATISVLAERKASDAAKAAFFEKIEDEHDDTMIRLKRAISSLHNRANLNLVFGIILSGSGVWVLWQTLSLQVHGDTPLDFLRAYLPRLSLVLVIELFSYFFLNLYKANLSETRYYHNELTNISNRRVALLCALESGEKEVVSDVIGNLSKTERNNVLSKGQMTFELAKAKIESNSSKNMTGFLEKLIESLAIGKKS